MAVPMSPPPAGNRSYVVIPARLASTRLPRKMLLRETGKPLVQHTYEAARQAVRPEGVCVAVDDPEVADAVLQFGGAVVRTSPDCATGTDRVAEVAAQLIDFDILVNVQGDEPEVRGSSIDLAVRLLEEHPEADMSTLATPIRTLPKLHSPACVKVVCDARGRALYFSRSLIPHPRDWHEDLLAADPPLFLQHIGLYAFRREYLLRFARMPRSPLEQVENLEQLRALSAGHTVQVGLIDEPAWGIDTPEDYRAFVSRCRNC